MSRLALALAAGAFLATACSTGISRDKVIRVAMSEVPDQAAVVVSAEARTYTGDERNPIPPRMAWVARLAGNFPIECPAPAANCPDVHNAEVVLDYYTGDFIAASYW